MNLILISIFLVTDRPSEAHLQRIQIPVDFVPLETTVAENSWRANHPFKPFRLINLFRSASKKSSKKDSKKDSSKKDEKTKGKSSNKESKKDLSNSVKN